MKVCINGTYSTAKSLNCSVPQGSCSRANVFTAYCSPIQEVVSPDLTLNGFADDHSINSTFKPSKPGAEEKSIKSIEESLVNVAQWMDSMRLKLNEDKTEFIVFGYRIQVNKCQTLNLNFNGNLIPVSSSVKYLGGVLDADLTFNQHINAQCRKAMFNLSRIRNIRQFLTRSAAETLVIGLCMSHLDYLNALLGDLPEKSIAKLQCVQNMMSKIVLNKSKYSSTTEALMELHWLPIRERINFKIITLVHKALIKEAPSYIQDLPQSDPLNSYSLNSSFSLKSSGKFENFQTIIIDTNAKLTF